MTSRSYGTFYEATIRDLLYQYFVPDETLNIL